MGKRFKITKKKKVMKRGCGQDHFNARQSGKQKRGKRLDRSLNVSDAKNIRQLLPYN